MMDIVEKRTVSSSEYIHATNKKINLLSKKTNKKKNWFSFKQFLRNKNGSIET